MADEEYQPFPDISAWTAVPFDPTTYEQYAALLEDARANATEEAREHAVRTAIRYAGTDTGAIEGLYTADRGFTRTVAIEAAGWETAANERGPNAAAIIKDQIEAYEWVLDLVTQARPVTEHVIRELHAMLCRSQDMYVVHTEVGPQERALPKGEYKTHPNNPTSLATGRLHHYAPPDMVSPEMGRLVGSLTTEAYRNAHPVVQASYLHYSLAAIHPFADGNGRVGRAIASVPLYRLVRVPLLVFRDQRDDYLDALEQADAGRLDAFVAFVRERVTEVIDLVIATTKLGGAADTARSIERLRGLVTSVGGRTHSELDAVADRLLDAAADAVNSHVATLDLPNGVGVNAGYVHGPHGSEPGYRIVASTPRVVQVTGTSSAPAHARWATLIVVGIATEPGRPDLVIAEQSSGMRSTFALREVDPAVSEVAKIKLASFAERIVAGVIAEVTAQAEQSLRQGGYLG